MRGKIFTPDEAERMLPLIERVSADVRTTYQEVHAALGAYDVAKKALAESGPGQVERLEADLRATDREVARLLDEFQGLIEEIEALGGMVKDYERGAVDFYGEVDGEIVFLCWQPGESRIAHWRPIENGQAERRPLPQTITL